MTDTVIYLDTAVACRFCAAYPEIDRGEPTPLSLFGLAPDGVYLTDQLPDPGGVSYTSFSPLPLNAQAFR